MKDLYSTDLGYDYPNDVNLRPGSDLSVFIIDEIKKRARVSSQAIQEVFPSWRQMDQTLSAYMPASEADLMVKSEDPRKPTNVVIPVTFASLETFLNYTTTALIQDIIHQYKSIGDKRAFLAAAKLELAIRMQGIWFKEARRLTTWFRDNYAYGLGIISPEWTHVKSKNPVTADVEGFVEAVLKESGVTDISVGDVVRYFEEQTLYEGNDVQNIDVYSLLLDPNTPIDRIQRANWIGWTSSANSLDLLSRELEPESNLTNAKYTHMLASRGMARSEFWNSDKSDRNKKMGISDDPMGSRGDTHTDRTVHFVNMIIDIIPSEWGLSDKDRPEKWYFRISGDEVINRATPLTENHGQYPVVAIASNSTGHDTFPVAHLNMTLGIQGAADFEIKSRFDNIRKTNNDMIIFDPTRVEEEDLLNPGPGKLIRLKQSFYGQGNIDQVIKQLDVMDITKGNIQDTAFLIDLLRQSNGTVDIAMGDLSSLPERPTRSGINAATTGALSRLQYITRQISVQGMTDLSYQMAYNTIQYMSSEIAVPLIGPHARRLREEFGLGPEDALSIDPFDLSPNFEIMPRDGSLPQLDSAESMAAMITPLLNTEIVIQSLLERLDFTGMFLQLARKSGFEDVHHFDKGQTNVVVGNDQLVQEQAQAGNLVPIGQG